MPIPHAVDVIGDFEQSWRDGDRRSVEECLAGCDELDDDDLLELVLTEARLRRDAGLPVDPGDYQARFPEQAESLRRLFEIEFALEEGSFPAEQIDSVAATRTVVPSESAAHALGLGEPPCTGLPTRYRVHRVLGRGGMGVVYLADDLDLGRPVAIKVPTLLDATGRARFLREARAVASLDKHPGICRIHDVGRTDDDRPYLSMEYVDGRNLLDICESRGRCDERETARIVSTVARSMARVHEHGVLHRDLKPANIMLDREGSPVVMDFGLARTSPEGSEDLTRPGMVMGSPKYMAPEQFDPRIGTLGPATDVYGLGGVMFRMLTGRPPVNGPVFAVLEQWARSEATETRAAALSEVDPALAALCRTALARDPNDRFASMDEFAAALDAWLGGEPTTPRIERREPRTRPWSRRTGFFSIVSALAVAAAAGIVAPLVGQRPGEPADAPRATARAHAIADDTDVTIGLEDVQVELSVWGERKPGLALDEPSALPLRNGDRVRFDVETTDPAHVYIVWIDADGRPAEVFPHDPERGPQEDVPRTHVHSPVERDRGWPVVGRTGMDTAVVLVRRTPHPDPTELIDRLQLAPQHEFNSPRESVDYAGGRAVVASVRGARHRGLGTKSVAIDDPVLRLVEELRDEFDVVRVVRVAHAGDGEPTADDER